MPRTRNTPEIKVWTNEDGIDIPVRATEGSSGYDLRASAGCSIHPGKRLLVSTGTHLEIPDGWEGQVRPRSGLAYHHGVTVLNAPGTIDADYRGEVKVLLINHGDVVYSIEKGERIAQIVFTPVPPVQVVRMEGLEETGRGDGGFGSTGKE